MRKKGIKVLKFIVIILALITFSFASFAFAHSEEEPGAVKKLLFKGTSTKVWLPDELALQLIKVPEMMGMEMAIGDNLLLLRTPYADFYIHHTNEGFYRKNLVVAYSFRLGSEARYWAHGKCARSEELKARQISEEQFWKRVETFKSTKKGKGGCVCGKKNLMRSIKGEIIIDGSIITILLGDVLIPVLLPAAIPSWIGEPHMVPQVRSVSSWLKLLIYGPWDFAVFNDRGTPKVIAIASYEFHPLVKCWKHGLKNGKFALEVISEMEYLGLLAEYHGKEE